MSDAEFAKVGLDTFEESAASPKVDEDFAGILIAMPSRLNSLELDRIALCGTWVLSHDVLKRYGSVEDDLVYLIRDLDTNQSFTGNFRMHEDPADPSEGADEDDAAPAPADDDAPAIGDEDITSQGWFNFNLGRVWKAPAKPARYRAVVVLDDLESNAVDFEVVR